MERRGEKSRIAKVAWFDTATVVFRSLAAIIVGGGGCGVHPHHRRRRCRSRRRLPFWIPCVSIYAEEKPFTVCQSAAGNLKGEAAKANTNALHVRRHANTRTLA